MAAVDSAIPSFRSSGVGTNSAPVTHQDQGVRVDRDRPLALDAQGVPETRRSSERVSNWKVHRNCGSPADGWRPTPCGSRARRGIIRLLGSLAGAASNQVWWL